MISAIYASLSVPIIVWLSLHVIKVRQQNHISVGDAGNVALQTAMGAHANAVENLPIGLLLLFALEFNAANLWLIHGFGLALLGSRLIHARGLLGEVMRLRVLGMQITIFSLIGLACANLLYLPYDRLFGQ